jgi:hypothetical protein
VDEERELRAICKRSLLLISDLCEYPIDDENFEIMQKYEFLAD